LTQRIQRIERPPRRGLGIVAGLTVWAGLCVAGTVLVADFGSSRVGSLARHQARAVFDTVVDFRAWNADHGGVWVEASPETPPNPYMPPDRRTRKTADGDTLTLVNPAYMTRKVGEISSAANGPVIRITSLKPLRPDNAPLPWERAALESFETGAQEYARFADRGSETPRYRYAAPLVTEASCLECHAEQGYQVGDVRGAVTVSLPASPFVAAQVSQRHTAYGLGVLLFVLGAAAIFLLGRMVRIRRETLAKLLDLSLRDPLTGLHNRRGFSERSAQALSTLARERGSAVLAFADLDGLKTVNDNNGHKRGDEALTRLAAALTAAFRGSDVVARIGGDEFAILFVDAAWEHRISLQARVDACVVHANDGWKGAVPIKVSVGMVDIDLSGEDSEVPVIDDLLSQADTRMYAVKTERRNTDERRTTGERRAID